MGSRDVLQVWSLDGLPDRTGFVSCSADGYVKVWKWAAGEDHAARLTLEEALSINTGQDVLCVRLSPDSKLLAASLISNVIKVCAAVSSFLVFPIDGYPVCIGSRVHKSMVVCLNC